VITKIQQVFIGCPFSKDVRRFYDRLKTDLEKETPLSVVLADTVPTTSADYLLKHITDLIRESAGCIFDATGNNPNVSLEVGIAHTVPVDFILALKTRKPRKTKRKSSAAAEAEVKAIISDLQGKSRIEYKTYNGLREQLEKRYLPQVPYIKRWNQFKKDHKSMVPYAIKIFSDIRSSGRTTKPAITAILEGSGFSTTDVSNALVRAKLVSIKRGRAGGYFYAAK
jgi:hypothetical protein